MANKTVHVFLGVVGVVPFALFIACVQNDVWWQEDRIDFLGVADFMHNIDNTSSDPTLYHGDTDWVWKKNPFRHMKDMDITHNGTDGYYDEEGDTAGTDSNDFCGEGTTKQYGDECCQHFEPIQNLMISSIVTAFCAWLARIVSMYVPSGSPVWAKWIYAMSYLISGTLAVAAVILWSQEFDDAVCGFESKDISGDFNPFKSQFATSRYLHGFNMACVGGGFAIVLSIVILVLPHKLTNSVVNLHISSSMGEITSVDLIF